MLPRTSCRRQTPGSTTASLHSGKWPRRPGSGRKRRPCRPSPFLGDQRLGLEPLEQIHNRAVSHRPVWMHGLPDLSCRCLSQVFQAGKNLELRCRYLFVGHASAFRSGKEPQEVRVDNFIDLCLCSVNKKRDSSLYCPPASPARREYRWTRAASERANSSASVGERSLSFPWHELQRLLTRAAPSLCLNDCRILFADSSERSADIHA